MSIRARLNKLAAHKTPDTPKDYVMLLEQDTPGVYLDTRRGIVDSFTRLRSHYGQRVILFCLDGIR